MSKSKTRNAGQREYEILLGFAEMFERNLALFEDDSAVFWRSTPSPCWQQKEGRGIRGTRVFQHGVHAADETIFRANVMLR